MSILDRLERKLGRFAIKELILYVVGLNLFIYLLPYFDPSKDAVYKLVLDPSLVMKGEVWRLITFIFIPPSASLLWIFFILYFYYMVGTGLEHEWGSFKFNIYYLAGITGTIIAAFITGYGSTALYLNLSLFLAFAYIYPDYEILLFFIIPVKVKYLAWLNWAFIAFTVLTAPLPAKAAAVASVLNYFLFFGRDIIINIKTGKTAYSNRQRFAEAFRNKTTVHKCTICEMTEKDDPKMEFRYCSTCKGDYEYCMNHLKAHEHIKKSKGD